MDESGSSSESAGNASFFIFNTRHKHLLYILFPFCDTLRSQEPIIIGFGLDYQRPLLDGFADQNH